MSVRLRVTEGEDIREFVFDRTEISIGAGAFNDIVLQSDGGGVHGRLEVDEGLRFVCEASGIPVSVIREEACISTVGGDERAELDVRIGDAIRFGADAPVELAIVERSDDEGEQIEVRDLSPAGSVRPGSTTSRLLWETTDAVSREPSVERLLRGIGAIVEAVVECRPGTLVLSFLEDRGEVQDHIYQLTVPEEGEAEEERLIAGSYERKRAPLVGLGVDRSEIVGAIADGETYAVRENQPGEPHAFVPVGTEAFRGVVEIEFHDAEREDDIEPFGVAGALIQPIGRIVLQIVEEELENLSLAEENRYFRERERRHYLFKDLVCESDAMREVYRSLDEWVDIDRPVLIEGEAGSGKSLLARALHHLGPADDSMLISLDCRELSDEVLDSELFGCVESELVGAVAPRKGVFELADEGTVFLEQIDQLSPMMQSKLLRVLKEGEVRRIGDSVGRKVGARLVASTHRDLAAMVERGAFRRDLYLLLREHVLSVPPLRERTEDIVPLARVYLETFSERYDRPCRSFSDAVAERLREHEWRGNARELKAVVESAVLKSDGEEVVGEAHLTL